MKLNPDTLATVGEALFGPNWQKPLSNALDVNDRTMRRWMNKDFNIPEGVREDLIGLCEESSAETAKLAKQLRSA